MADHPSTLQPSEEAPPLLKKPGQAPKPATAGAMSANNQAVNANTDNQPPVKKSKGNDANVNASPSPAPQPLKKDKPKPTLRTLPEQKCDPYPGIIAQKATRQTSAQVAADKKWQEELKQSLDEIAKRKVEILAEMETLTDIESLEKAEDSGDDGGDTEIENNVSRVVSRSKDVVKTQVPPVKVRRKKKPGKGEMQAAVNTAKAEIKGKRKASIDLEMTR
ncbi:hypothetical protein BJV74DRAFT_795938 [Russula compacta]|nr:hypothetical protein BJV74DRAFT_795938 [Russula compacta]